VLRPCTTNQQITRKSVGRAAVATLAPDLRQAQPDLGKPGRLFWCRRIGGRILNGFANFGAIDALFD
jgi:hypothetical protein